MSKLIIGLILAAVLLGSITACSAPAVESAVSSSPVSPIEVTVLHLNPETHNNIFNGKTMAIIYQDFEETVLEQSISDYYKRKFDFDFNCNLVYVDSLTDGLLMLRSGKVDVLQVIGITGKYLLQRNSDLSMYSNELESITTQMIFRPDKAAELESINRALEAMQEDGSLDSLVQEWITDLPVGQEPAGGEMPAIQGAATLKVGVSGDVPPLDYIAADGTPGGFNVAALSEIGRRAGLNIKLVKVSGGARFTALQSGKIDAFFWHNTNQGFTSSEGTETESGFLRSEVYLTSPGALLVLK